MGRKTSIWRRHITRILSVVFLLFQGVILDYYLIADEDKRWFAWIVTDVIVLTTWITAMVMSYKRQHCRQYSSQGKAILKDELAFAYIAWLVYALHLVPQVATLFRMKTHHLDEETMVFGPNFLKMSLCITPALFLFLIFAHHDSKPHTLRKFYLEKLTGVVTLDLFDSVEMLEYLFDKTRISHSVELSILSFSCINFFLPVLALYELKHNKFHESGQVSPVSYKILYLLLFMFLVNVPFLVIRLYLWHEYDMDISVLLAKNVLAIILGFIDILEFCGDERPRKCLACSYTFAKSSYKGHLKACGVGEEIKQLEELKLVTLNGDHLVTDRETVV